MKVTKTRGYNIKQINNIKIRYLPELNYFAVSPKKEVIKYNMTLKEAELYCARCKDYLKR
jgi:hypothetical protein